MAYTRTFTVIEGNGKIDIYMNGVFQGTATNTTPYILSTLNLNDTYRWVSIPDSGYIFNKYCWEDTDPLSCATISDQNSYISDTARITRPIGVYFSESSTYTRTFTVIEGKGKINIYMNEVFQGTATNTTPYILSTLNLNDTYRWVSIPDSGYIFNKYCWEDTLQCESLSDKLSTITTNSTITRPVGVYFSCYPSQCNFIMCQ